MIDSHQHWRSTPDYIPTLVKTYRARNAMACVLTPIDSLDALMAAAKQYPDVIIPYGYLDVDHPDARAQLETFAKAGVKGIKMHRPKLNWDDFGYFPLYGTDAGTRTRRPVPHRHRRRQRHRGAGAVVDGTHAARRSCTRWRDRSRR